MRSKAAISLANFSGRVYLFTCKKKQMWYAVDMLTKELGEKILNHSPDSIYVADKNGVTIFVNRAFQELTGICIDDVIGKSVYELESKEYFRPSVLRLVLEEKRPISILQRVLNGKQIVVSAVPVFDQAGEIDIVLSNAKLVDEMQDILTYFKEKENSSYDVDDEKTVIGNSREILEILHMVEQIKDTNSTILITGETGSGKGVLARHIHITSNRAKRKLIEINCGAIPENLLESELFGYERGAFTGANATGKQGLIEAAQGGTLLLDEISELPFTLQVKLLKVLQDKRFMRIGGRNYIDVDIRFIAASNRNLVTLVKEGKFRADLYYRLSVIPIEIPALRNRKQDISVLARHFLQANINKYHKDVNYTEAFLEAIMVHDWPGNVRELENYIERKVLTTQKNVLDKEDAYDISRLNEFSSLIETLASTEQPLNDAMETLERKIILTALEKYGSSYGVAEALGISQTKAYRKIMQYAEDKSKRT